MKKTLSALVLFALCLFAAAPAQAIELTVGKPLPKVDLLTSKGDKAPLQKYTAGSPALVVYWSIGCHVCLQEVPMLLQEYQKSEKPAYKLILVAGEMPEMREVSWCFAERKNPSGRAVVLQDDVQGQKAPFADAIKIEYTPTLIFLDKSGKVVRYFEGSPTKPDYEAALKKMLK